MDSDKRRQEMFYMIQDSKTPLTGAYLSKNFNVSRQVVVQDIALLRAAGHEIIATPQGYLLPRYAIPQRMTRLLALKHNQDDIEDELMSIVDLGGKILDVIVEHPIYGEFKGQLMLGSASDIRDYLEKMKREGAEPLSSLTEGVHLHTIEADNVKSLDKIEKVLDEKGYLLKKDE